MLIGMSEAAKRLGVSSSDSARRALLNAGVPLVRIHERALAVEETDLEEFIAKRADYQGMGRPRNATPKMESKGETEV